MSSPVSWREKAGSSRNTNLVCIKKLQIDGDFIVGILVESDRRLSGKMCVPSVTPLFLSITGHLTPHSSCH
jgi:hypothetical protein